MTEKHSLSLFITFSPLFFVPLHPRKRQGKYESELPIRNRVPQVTLQHDREGHHLY